MVLGERPGDIVEKWERVRSMEEQIAKLEAGLARRSKPKVKAPKESSKPKTKGKKKK
jgi:hypothetical protein